MIRFAKGIGASYIFSITYMTDGMMRICSNDFCTMEIRLQIVEAFADTILI